MGKKKKKKKYKEMHLHSNKKKCIHLSSSIKLQVPSVELLSKYKVYSK